MIYISTNVVPSLGADGMHTMKMCQAFAQEGYPATLVAPRGRIDPSLAGVELRLHYGLEQSIPIVRLPHPGRMGRHLYRAFAAFYSFVRREEFVYSRCLPTAMLTTRLGLPTIWETSDIAGTGPQLRYLRWLVNANGFLGIVVVSSALRDWYIELLGRSLEGDRIVVARNGVDLEPFDRAPTEIDAKAKLGIDTQQFVAGYVGHLYSGRGMDLILELAKNSGDVLFLVVGGTTCHVAEWKHKASDADLQNLRFTGFIPNSRLPDYYAACNVLLMPYGRRVAVSGNRGDTSRWMSPMKLFEYMAARRPIIASDLPAIREVLDVSSAALCEPEDARAWLQALRQAVDDEAWRVKVSEKARCDVERYTWRRRVAHILNELR
jgi:glycosyltransferase involved in cell wall biosynthesis